MGFIIPSLQYDDVNSNIITVSNAYVAIAHFDVNIRNYKPELFPNMPTLRVANDHPITQTTVLPPQGILPGMSILVNFGIWESKESRDNKEPPVTMRTIQGGFDPTSSNIYEIAYSLVKGVFPDAQDDLVVPSVEPAPPSEPQ